jgi:hypothetical protein
VPIDDLRRELMGRIDALLGRPLLIWGRDRQLLTALRGYVATMQAADLERLEGLLAYHAGENTARPDGGEA